MENVVAIKPKLGFVGMGWIGKSRLKAIQAQSDCDIFSAIDPDTSAFEELKEENPGIQTHSSLQEMLLSDVDGIVIASPSALHAKQCIKALNSGKAVFCQKPLGRNKQETQAVVEAAQANNLLLKVDFSYRYTAAVQQLKKVLESGELGHIYGANLVFHNAYGPDKEWYVNPDLSGGGCLMDLGIHLVDLLFWLFDDPTFNNHQSQYFYKGKPDFNPKKNVEDYATAQFVMDDETAIQLSCSWFLPAGKDAIIEAAFYGENGGISFKNINGSFYDFTTERYFGTKTETLVSPPDNWEGKAAVKWSEELCEGKTFDEEAFNYVKVAQEIETLYQSKIS
ncbi:MAG: Gfo/Idh/MocA family oxidoreductase [Balneolaceae bacterium]